MADPEDVNYSCSLTDYSLKKAITELNEDSEDRLNAVQSLRKWIRQQSHYTCRTDTKFLLAFLRRAKFNQLVARKLIDNFLHARTSWPEYMTNLDTQHPDMLAYIEKRILLILPNPDAEGRMIAIVRLNKIDLKDPRINIINETRCCLALVEMFQDVDENFSVNGIIIVFDCSGAEFKQLHRATAEQIKTMAKIYQDNIPIRIKEYVFYNGGAVLEMFLMIMKAFLKKKTQERMQTCETLQSLYNMIPMEVLPTEYLPENYKGPSAGSVDSIFNDLERRMTNPEVRNHILALTSDRYRIDESERTTDGVSKESFKKFNSH